MICSRSDQESDPQRRRDIVPVKAPARAPRRQGPQRDAGDERPGQRAQDDRGGAGACDREGARYQKGRDLAAERPHGKAAGAHLPEQDGVRNHRRSGRHDGERLQEDQPGKARIAVERADRPRQKRTESSSEKPEAERRPEERIERGAVNRSRAHERTADARHGQGLDDRPEREGNGGAAELFRLEQAGDDQGRREPCRARQNAFRESPGCCAAQLSS